jgi:hypothetical protein
MEGLLDRIRSFFTGIKKILPLKGTTHVRILDSNGLIDESLQQAVEEEPKIILREAVAPDVAAPGVASPAVTKKALTELE